MVTKGCLQDTILLQGFFCHPLHLHAVHTAEGPGPKEWFFKTQADWYTELPMKTDQIHTYVGGLKHVSKNASSLLQILDKGVQKHAYAHVQKCWHMHTYFTLHILKFLQILRQTPNSSPGNAYINSKSARVHVRQMMKRCDKEGSGSASMEPGDVKWWQLEMRWQHSCI